MSEASGNEAEKIVFSEHAKKRLSDRKIPFAKAKEVLADGERFILASGARLFVQGKIGLVVKDGVVVTVCNQPKKGTRGFV